MAVINLREQWGHRFKISFEEAYYGQYGPNARVDDPHYQIIPGKLGHVYAWGAEWLAASTNTSGSVAARLKVLPGTRLWQDGSDGVTVLFKVEHFELVANLLKLRRRRQTSEQERRRLAELGRKYRFRSAVAAV
jgi:hypothetical protein